jgi:hypothetical protein
MPGCFALLSLTPTEAAPPGPAQAGYFEAPPGPVHAGSAPEAKVAFFGALFAARTDIYAVRYENRRAGRAGWVPAVRGGWRKGVPHAERDYLPLTAEVLAAHLSGKMHIGLYPLLDGDRCWSRPCQPGGRSWGWPSRWNPSIWQTRRSCMICCPPVSRSWT